jgi:hypothetical protein
MDHARRAGRHCDVGSWGEGYDQGYEAGQEDGHLEGIEAYQRFLLGALRYVREDIRLELRHDMASPIEVLAHITALVEARYPEEGEP